MNEDEGIVWVEEEAERIDKVSVSPPVQEQKSLRMVSMLETIIKRLDEIEDKLDRFLEDCYEG